MEQILMVKKENKVYSEAEVKEIFNTSISLDEIKKVVENAEDRLYTSWATVDAIDKENQKIPIDEAIKQQEILMKRDAPIQDTHTNKNIGKTLAYRVLEHPVTKTTGILQLNKIYKDNILDDKVWKETVSGERTGSSVGGFSTDRQIESDSNGIFESLKGFNWLETSNVKAPCNSYATNQAVSLIAKQDKMVEDNKTEVKKEEMSTETPEVSIDDRVSALEEGLGAVVSKLDELIQATAGTPEVEKESEGEEADGNPAEEAEVEKEEESTEDKEDDVSKTLKEIKSELSEVKKQLNDKKVVEVVKTEMPEVVNKTENTTHKFSDVMKGKVSLEEFTRGN